LSFPLELAGLLHGEVDRLLAILGIYGFLKMVSAFGMGFKYLSPTKRIFEDEKV
jgi:hypothetical protein